MSEAENDTKTDSGLSDVIQQFPSDAPQEDSAKSSEESHEHTFEREREHKLLLCVQRILRDNGFNYSEAAIRDLPDLSQEMFNPRDAVSALSNSGFVASCGELKPSEITDGHCPLIGFSKEGDAFLILAVTPDGLRVADPASGFKERTVNKKAFSGEFNNFVVLALRKPEVKGNSEKSNWFWGSLRQSKWLYAQVLIAAALSNFLGLSTSLFIMVVYDRVVPNEAIESLIALTIGILIALGFDFVIKSLRGNFIDRAGKRADSRMSRLIFDKLLAMRLDQRKEQSGALASVVREFETLRDFFTSATLVAVVDLPFIFLFIWVISIIAGPLALVPLIAVPLVIITGLVIQPFLARLASGSMDTSMSKQAILVETLNGLETVQATGSGRLMRKRFEEAAASQSEIGLKSRILTQFAVNSAASIQQLAQIMIIFFGVFLISEGTITMGAMIAAVILSGRALGPLGQLASAMSRANNARQSFRSLNRLMNEDTDAEELQQRLSRPRLSGDIEFKNVSYTFPGAKSPIIRNLSLKIPAGQKVALVGRMGSGKSTLARLASGLLQPTEGSVLIDGVDLRQIDKSDLRRNVGVMLQETWLFSGTLRENIQMGYYEYEDHYILDVAKIAGVDDFVASHPSGYDLVLRERGEGLSGGQRQSINLARALLHSPNLLVLDEPTSSMDTATEKSVLDRLKSWLENRTLLVVTHRNTLLRLADRVLVMDQGNVMADTTPERLQAANK
ncbi:type I secretion system permease/ATPase [Tateyamaria pelophila]|uniref:type I secretion system permease/ATPase n=1 Tax=Tateyamaria pelophila TaxID=328415 RepID=UPI001CBDCA13|nr:type I secretion system permease/ATPase [Tateyamaria pelophila]